MTKLMGTCALKRIKEKFSKAAAKTQKKAANQIGEDTNEISSFKPEKPDTNECLEETPAVYAKKSKEGETKRELSKAHVSPSDGKMQRLWRRLRGIRHDNEDWSRAWGSMHGKKQKRPTVKLMTCAAAGLMAMAVLTLMVLPSGSMMPQVQKIAVSANMAQSIEKRPAATKDATKPTFLAAKMEAPKEEAFSVESIEEVQSTPKVLADVNESVREVENTFAATTTTLTQEDTAVIAALELSTVIDTVDLEALPTPDPAVAIKAATELANDELVEFFVRKADVYYDELGYSTNYYDYTDDEFYLLAQIIDIESRGEPFEGMVAVGNVVMNRVLNTEEFHNTITGVVKSGQFAYSGHSSRRPSKVARKAAKAVLDDEYWVIPQDVYFFKSNSKPGKDWKTREFYTSIAGHCFYTYDYSGRCLDGDVPPRLYERVYKYAQYGCEPGERVRRIQTMLNEIGFHVTVDSRFSKETMEALMLFQETNGLVPDGIAEPATIKALIKAYGFDKYHEQFVTEQQN